MKILVVLPRFPYPLDKGDKLRAYHQIVELAKHHEIHLFAVSHTKVPPEQRAALEPYCKTIAIVTPSRFTAYFNMNPREFINTYTENPDNPELKRLLE